MINVDAYFAEISDIISIDVEEALEKDPDLLPLLEKVNKEYALLWNEEGGIICPERKSRAMTVGEFTYHICNWHRRYPYLALYWIQWPGRREVDMASDGSYKPHEPRMP